MRSQIIYENQSDNPRQSTLVEDLQVYRNQCNLWCYSFSVDPGQRRLCLEWSQTIDDFFSQVTKQWGNLEFKSYSARYSVGGTDESYYVHIIPESLSEQLEIENCVEATFSEGIIRRTILIPRHLFHPPVTRS